jgi:hypothetical protein
MPETEKLKKRAAIAGADTPWPGFEFSFFCLFHFQTSTDENVKSIFALSSLFGPSEYVIFSDLTSHQN